MEEMILTLCQRLDTNDLDSILTHCAWHRAHSDIVPSSAYRERIISAIAETLPYLPENGLLSVYDLAVRYNSH